MLVKLLNAIRYLLWTAVLLLVLGILALNVLPIEVTVSPVQDVYITFGTLLVLDFAMLAQTLCHKKENASLVNYGYKLAFVLLCVLATVIGFLTRLQAL